MRHNILTGKAPLTRVIDFTYLQKVNTAESNQEENVTEKTVSK